MPAGTRVARKTGWITGIDHDGGIVFPPNQPPYVLVVLTRGIMDRPVTTRTSADISRMVWNALVDPDWQDDGQAQAPPAPTHEASTESVSLKLEDPGP